MNANCNKIYDLYTALQMKSARAEVSNEMKLRPKNIMPIVLADYGDFFELFFNEDAKKYEELSGNKSLRLKSIELCSANSQEYLFSKAQIYFHWAIIKLKYKDYFSAAVDLRKAYGLYKECKSKYPQNLASNIYIGTIECLAGTIPDNYKWVSNLLGINANLIGGAKMVADYASNSSYTYFNDAVFLDTYLKQYLLNNQIGAWANIQRVEKLFVKNKLLCFMGANIALNQHKANLTIKYLDLLYNKTEYLDMPVVNYEYGCAYLYSLNKSKAELYLKNYINTFKGKFYIKDTYYKLCLLAYMFDENEQSKKYLNLILTQGNTESDADKKALDFAKEKVFPNKQILKSRFLFDGGDFKSSLEILNSVNIATLKNFSEVLEFYYRKGRILQLQNELVEAEKNYLICIEKGSVSKTYFASRSALFLGQMYEVKKDKAKAKQYYNLCLSMKNHEYKSSIDQMAKSGLLRVK